MRIRRWISRALASMAFLLPAGPICDAQTIYEDRVERLEGWSAFNSAGVAAAMSQDAGYEGKGLRMDIDFRKGSGYGGVVRNLNLSLPERYRLVLMLRGDVPVNDFEVKISSDSGGENIWWVNSRKYEYPRSWKRVVLKKRHFTFAWGPRPSSHPDTLRRIEFVVTAGNGGKGSIWIDNVEIQEVPPPPNPLPRTLARASASATGSPPQNIIPGVEGSWRGAGDGNAWVELDYGYPREFNCVRIAWPHTASALDYALLGSLDGRVFDTVRVVRGGAGGTRYLYTPEAEARVLRIALINRGVGDPAELADLDLISGDSVGSRNDFGGLLASTARRGHYPRYLLREKSYWTIVGVEDSKFEGLMNEDGMWEPGPHRFSLEPFVRMSGGRLLTWADSEIDQSLADRYLPIPTVTRTTDKLELSITLLADGASVRSTFMARYVLRNTSGSREDGSLYLTVRPFQVNPAYQWLNNVGGVGNLRSIRVSGNRALVNDSIGVSVSANVVSSGATNEDAGGIVHHLVPGLKSMHSSERDIDGLTSAAFEFEYSLAPGDSLIVVAAVPAERGADRWQTTPPNPEEFERIRLEREQTWSRRVNTVRIDGPAPVVRLFDILRSTMAYILINKDGHGIQPGSRSYERSWIRDGSMTSSALLKFGIRDEVRDFVSWYAGYQYENGMVPCVVDGRGPDPVPENDSHGQLIFAFMEYFRFTGDTLLLRSHWQHISAAVDYIQVLRGKRMTEEYAGEDEKRAFYGLVPESISHEGYSSKPMHSYWDDFFVLKGLKDAAEAASILGYSDFASRYDGLARAFRTDLYASIRRAMKLRRIDYIPGCVELGDFDPTSTSIGLFPAGEMEYAPQPEFRNTFEKYYRWFLQRSRGEIEWSAYTPYEIRNVGTFVYLGEKERAHVLLDWFLEHQRPIGWNHWAEVVWKDDRHAAFIGDMPHTWVGSDFMNAVRSMFVYEIQESRTLILGAGLRSSWLEKGIVVRGLPTHYGDISFSAADTATGEVRLSISGTIDPGTTNILVSPGILRKKTLAAFVNEQEVAPMKDGSVPIRELPATVRIRY